MFDKKTYMRKYMRKYYKEHREKILTQQKKREQEKYRDFRGHVAAIHDPIRRYASQWHIPIESLKKFKRWSFNDPVYEELFKAWEASGFDKKLSPVVMRRVKKRGFVIDNLYWSAKGQHSWWNGLLDEIKNMSKEMEKRQIKNNKATEVEQQEMLNRLRTKRKSK